MLGRLVDPEERRRRTFFAGKPWLDPARNVVTVRDLAGGRFEADPRVTYWFEQVTVTGVDFSRNRFGVRLDVIGGFHADRSTFVGCDFRGVKFERATFGGFDDQSVYRDCSFDDATLVDRQTTLALHLGNARFERCSFDGAKIRGWLPADLAEFVDCSFATRVDRCGFYGTPPRRTPPRRDRNAFHGNDFSRAELVDTNFCDIDLDAQRWPAEGYIRLDDADARLRAAYDRTDEVPDELRLDVQARLRTFGRFGHRQDTLILRRVEPEDRDPRVREWVWRLLDV